MRLRDHYDWVVIGDHPGALLSGNLAARLGLSVLILPLSPGQNLWVSKDGQYLDAETNYILGMGGQGRHPGILRECLNRLGLLPAEEFLIESQGSVPQILTSQHSLGFPVDDSALELELNREFGVEKARNLGFHSMLKRAEDEFLTFWLKLPERLTLSPNPSKKPSSFTGSLNLKSIQKKLLRETKARTELRVPRFGSDLSFYTLARETGIPGLEEIGDGFWFGVISGMKQPLMFHEFFHALALSRTGASFRGGLSAYRQFLMRLARRLGADIPPKADCKRIFVENGRFVGAQLSSRGNMIAANGGVLGCSLSQAHERLAISGRTWLRRLKSPPRAFGWKFTLAFTVHSEAIPPGMARRVIWQEKNSPGLEIEVTDPGDFHLREKDHRIVFARTVMPFGSESLDPSYQRMIAARMLRKITEIIPFFEFHVVKIYPDFRVPKDEREQEPNRNGSEEGIEQIYGFAQPDLIPENLRCYSEGGIGSASGIDGLFLSSGEAYPELGSLGGALSALEAVAWLAHRSGLPGPFG